MHKLTEKELYDMGNCIELHCGNCPFWKSPLEEKYRFKVSKPTLCYKTFTDYYEKQLVIDYVLGDNND